MWIRNCTGYMSVALVTVLLPCVAAGQSKVDHAVAEKARALEGRGLPDLAAQTWQQLLLSQPENAEALAGLARIAKEEGKDAEAAGFLRRLRQMNPKDPQIAVIESMVTNKERHARQAKAETLAAASHYTEAMKIYRELYGEQPPGEVALEYYDTEAATEAGRSHATAALRALAKLHPGQARYQTTLGRVLTYNPKTRAEGEGMLQQWPQDAAGQAALRQALLWDAQNPEAAGAIKRFLETHPDRELTERLQEQETNPARPPQSAADREEQSAYAALQANQVDLAEQGFRRMLERAPGDPRGFAGMGFAHMKQRRFDLAVDDFTAARQHGLRSVKIESALNEARFWQAMSEATTALNQNHLELAAERYRDALTQRPASPEALAGLGGTLLRGRQTREAAQIYTRWLKVQPDSAAAWRGLFMARAQGGEAQPALEVSSRFPETVRAVLVADPEYLVYLASAYRAAGDDTNADRTLNRGLNLPFPDNGRGMPASLRLQYAALLAAAKHYEQAAGLYNQVIAEEPDNAAAWQALMLAQHQQHDDAGVLHTLEQMPPPVYQAASTDRGFLSVIAAAYQQEGRLDEAQHLLEKAAAAVVRSGSQMPADFQLQLAAIERQRGNLQHAAQLDRLVINADPQRTDAWRELLSTRHQAGDDSLALHELASVPPQAQGALAGNDEYLLTLSSIYAATGNTRLARAALSRLRSRLAAQSTPASFEVEIQMVWLLLNLGDEPALHTELMHLGERKDLADSQRRQVQAVWAEWSVRRASQAVKAGNPRQALVILNAAREALAGNDDVSRSLADGYLAAGDPSTALAMFEKMNLSTAPDYQSAIGAALGAKNLKLTETWTHQSLELYPQDARLLGLAARFEQARGDNARALAYWKASLANSTDAGAASRLADTLRTSSAQPSARESLPGGDALAALLGGPLHELEPAIRLPGETSGDAVVNEPAARESDADPAASANEGTNSGGGKSGTLSNYRPPPRSPVSQVDSLPLDGGEAAGAEDSSRTPRLSSADVRQQAGATASISPPTLRYASAWQANGPSGGSVPQPETEMTSLAKDLTDQPLINPRLPSLRGAYPPARSSTLLSARQEAQQQIASIEGDYSPWIGGTGDAHHRSGTPGFDQLTALEAPFEASTPLGMIARLTVITTPVFLDAGVATGTSTLGFGSLPAGKAQPQQYADGVASEVQFASSHFAAAAGQTPNGFLVRNITGGVRWQPAGGPLTFSFSRESVKETQLSYSGLRDPGSATATFGGNIWGGVIANSGDVRVDRGDAVSGFYASAGGQHITGEHVLTNTRWHGNAGAYWRVLSLPDLGTLVLGANFFGMHYAHNLRYFTYGQGGYFSPEAYFVAAVPVTWTGHYGPLLHYNITGSIGGQSFQEDSSPYFPLDPGLQAAFGNPVVPVRASVSANYDLRSEIAYRIQDHWYVGGFLNLNNTQDYQSQSGGFFVRYLFRQQSDSEAGPTGLFPHEGFRPVTLP